MSYHVKFYQSSRGEEPVREFIEKQNEQTKAKFSRLYLLLTNFGPDVPYPHVKHISGKLFELRIRGRTEIRVFYARFGDNYVLLHAFQKKSQKTPDKELRIAMKRLT